MCTIKVATVIATNLENKFKVKDLVMSLLKSKDDAEMLLVDDFDKFERTADAKTLARLALDICDFRLEIDAVHSFEKNHCFMLLVGGMLGTESVVAAFSSGLQKEIANKLDNKDWSPIYSDAVEVLSVYRSAEGLIAVPCKYYLASANEVYNDKDMIVATAGDSKLLKAALEAVDQYFGSFFDTDSFVL